MYLAGGIRKENDNDIGNGAQDYGMRIYDGRLGRFLSVDPITNKYPELTPYQFASNTPIQAIDVDGLEAWIVKNKWNEHYISLFRTTVASNIRENKTAGKKFTCDDLRLETIVTFSKANNLPFK